MVKRGQPTPRPPVAPPPRRRDRPRRRSRRQRSARAQTRRPARLPAPARRRDVTRPGEARMEQIDVERSQEFRKCIECFLCQDVCHVVRDHEENKKSFAGPRFFIRIAELDMHPLDMLKNRKQKAQEEHGLGMCNITKCCTEVCPEHIRITDNAIIPMKERVVDTKYDPIRWLGSKIRKREGME